METQQHEGKSLPYIVVHPDGYQEGVRYPMIILLHGYGANMADLAGLAPAIHRTGYVYACPNAPVPANRSSIEAPTMRDPSQSKSPSRARSAVGRVPLPATVCSRRPRK